MLGPTAMALPGERRLGQLASALHIHEPVDVPALARLYARVMHDLPQTLCRLSPITRLNSNLQPHFDSVHPEQAEHVSVAEDGSYAADVVLTCGGGKAG